MTLLELLTALAVLSILASMSFAGFNDLRNANIMRSAVNDLVSAFYLARQKSWASGKPVVVCQTTDGQQCASGDARPTGWLAFINQDAEEPPRADPGDTLLQVWPARPGLHIATNRPAFILRPAGRRSTNGTLTLCGPASVRGQQVVVSYTGKARARPAAHDEC